MILFYILPVRTLSLREIEKRAACSAGSMCQAQDFPTAAEGASALWAGREKGGSQRTGWGGQHPFIQTVGSGRGATLIHVHMLWRRPEMSSHSRSS